MMDHTLTFIQGDDQVSIELDGTPIWEESSWGSLDQFLRYFAPKHPVVFQYREAV